MRRTLRKRKPVVARIRRFDAKHARPFIVAEIAHRRSFLRPRIPDNGGVRSFLFNEDATSQQGIFQRACTACIDENAIGFALETESKNPV